MHPIVCYSSSPCSYAILQVPAVPLHSSISLVIANGQRKHGTTGSTLAHLRWHRISRGRAKMGIKALINPENILLHRRAYIRSGPNNIGACTAIGLSWKFCFLAGTLTWNSETLPGGMTVLIILPSGIWTLILSPGFRFGGTRTLTKPLLCNNSISSEHLLYFLVPGLALGIGGFPLLLIRSLPNPATKFSVEDCGGWGDWDAWFACLPDNWELVAGILETIVMGKRT